VKLLKTLIFLFVVHGLAAQPAYFLPYPAESLVKHSYFTLSYNEKYEQANWVYYLLTDSMVLNGGQERSNNFKMDKSVETVSSKSSDYTKSGYDRGHLCPAADMGFSELAMEESFLMSNISPQVPDFNRGIWKELETTVREWAKKERKLFVVTGPVFKDDKGFIGKEDVLVPGYYYKIVYDVTDEPKMIAFVLPNERSDRPLTDFVVTTDKAEELTGFDFFSQLPDNVENQLEGKVQLAGWFAGYEPERPTAQQAKFVGVNSDIQFYLILVLVILLVVLIVALRKRGSRKRRKR